MFKYLACLLLAFATPLVAAQVENKTPPNIADDSELCAGNGCRLGPPRSYRPYRSNRSNRSNRVYRCYWSHRHRNDRSHRSYRGYRAFWRAYWTHWKHRCNRSDGSNRHNWPNGSYRGYRRRDYRCNRSDGSDRTLWRPSRPNGCHWSDRTLWRPHRRNRCNWRTGATGASTGILDYGDFYALMPGDNATTVAAGGSVEFPEDGDTTAGITRVPSSASTFQLAAIGTYYISFQVSVTQAGQLVVVLNGSELAYTVVGRATGTSQLVGTAIIRTTAVDSILSINTLPEKPPP